MIPLVSLSKIRNINDDFAELQKKGYYGSRLQATGFLYTALNLLNHQLLISFFIFNAINQFPCL